MLVSNHATKTSKSPTSGSLPSSLNVEGGPIRKPKTTDDDGDQDSFYKLYNKEIKVNQDQIPIILAELTDAALNLIQRDSFEKALILLQKAEGVLEVVSLDSSSRDKFVLFVTNNNMAMCFQKLGMLDECNTYLKHCLAMFKDESFFAPTNKSLATIAGLAARNRRNKLECRLRLQQCAILSQT